MRIGILAARAGITTSRIRFYEARGLLPCPTRNASGYRDYDERAPQILDFITRARALGFSLREVAAHINSPADSTRKVRLLWTIHTKVGELDKLLTDIQTRRAILMSLIEEVRAAIPKT